MAQGKTIAAIIATHNGKTRGYLLEAIESALGQTLCPSEVLVIDDASTDGTAEFLSERYGRSLTIVALPENLGPSGARNYGIRMATAPLVAFLDDDDKWLPKKLERQVAVLEEQGSDLVFGRADGIDARGNPLGTLGPIYPESLAWPGILFRNPVPGPSSVLARRDALLDVGGFPETFRIGEDWLLWAKLTRQKAVHFIDETVTQYRFHPHQAAEGRSHSWIREQTMVMLRTMTSDLRPDQANLVLEAYAHGGALRALMKGRLRDSRRLLRAGSGHVDWSILLGLATTACLGRFSPRAREWAIRRHLQSLVRRFCELDRP